MSNSDSFNNELTNDNSGESKNGVLECKVVSRESVDEVMSVCVERLNGQRASVPQVYCKMECSQVFYEDRVSSGGGVEDKVSSYGLLVFCGLPGSRGNKYLMVPFAWNGRVQCGYERCCNEREREREREREIEIFEINRDYERLVQVLDIERDEKSELHGERLSLIHI